MDELDTGKLRAMLAAAVQEDDDVRYYGGPTGTYRPHRDALNAAVERALPTLLDTIDTLRQQLAEAMAEAFHPDGESYRELWLVSKANVARAAKVANEYRGMIKTVCIIPNCQRPAPDSEPFCSKHRDNPHPRIGGQP